MQREIIRLHDFPAKISNKQRRPRFVGFAKEGGDAAQLDAIDQFLLTDANHVHRHLTGDQLRAAVDPYWVVDEIRPAYIHATVPPLPEGTPAPPIERDAKGRMKMPALLLRAHKPA